jgi:hypothetical protein
VYKLRDGASGLVVKAAKVVAHDLTGQDLHATGHRRSWNNNKLLVNFGKYFHWYSQPKVIKHLGGKFPLGIQSQNSSKAADFHRKITSNFYLSVI